jgi:hypothetical protein
MQHAATLRETVLAGRDLDICCEVQSFSMRTLPHTLHVVRTVVTAVSLETFEPPTIQT